MGRPRKRRLVDDTPANLHHGADVAAESSSSSSSSSLYLNNQVPLLDNDLLSFASLCAEDAPPLRQLQPPQHDQHHSHHLASTSLYPGFDFLDETLGASGLDILGASSGDPYYPIGEDPLAAPSAAPCQAGGVTGDMSLDGGDGLDILDGINFGDPAPISLFGSSEDISDSLQTFIAFDQSSDDTQWEDTSASGQSSSSNTAVSPPATSDEGYDTSNANAIDSGKAAENARPLATVVCSCLSSLYFSLDALARLPDDVHSAMRVTRGVTKVAHDIIICPKCSLPLIEEPLLEPSMQAVQNLMLLGALLPSAVNAYARILELIDRDVDAAKKEKRLVHFAFKDVGGLWGHRVESSRPGGATVAALDNTDLDPDVWRATVRAVLKLDVYGIGSEEEAEDVPEKLYKKRNQLGLKDVIMLLDSRHAKRHERIDAAYYKGEQPKTIQKGLLFHPRHQKPVPVEQRNCVNILEPARTALSNLSIS